MGGTIQQIIDMADELADRFEAFDPSLAEEVPVQEFELRHAARATRRSHERIAEGVAMARLAGTPWSRIGEILDLSGPEAERRYGALAGSLGSGDLRSA